jgi:hypothetical protein
VTRRTKLWICVGVLVLMVGAVMVGRPAKPVLEASFVRYATNGEPVVNFTNRGQRPVYFFPLGDRYLADPARAVTSSLLPRIVLAPVSGTQVVARLLPWSQPPLRGETFSVQCVLEPSALRRRVGVFLNKAGIFIVSTGFVATVNLPPRPTPSPPP